MKMLGAVGLLAFLAAVSFVGAPHGAMAQKPEKIDVSSNLSGFWRVVANVHGAGLFTGRMTVRRRDRDAYQVTYQLVGGDDTPLQRSGAVTVKNGTDWRGTLVSGQTEYAETATVSPDGNSISGHWSRPELPYNSGYFRAVRMVEGVSVVMAVDPPTLKRGEAAELTIYGAGLTGPVSLGAGVRITGTVVESPVTIILQVRVAKDAAPGRRAVSVGNAKAPLLFSIER